MPRADPSLRTYSLPAPTGGVDGVSTLFEMPENRAISIVNGVCEPYGIRNRQRLGSSVGTGTTGTVGAIGELVGTDGTSDKFIIYSNAFYQANGGTARTGSLTITDAGWQTAQFKYRIFGVNGVDQPLEWIGDGNNATATAWTGTSLTISNLWNVSSFKGDLVFLEKGAFGWWVPNTAKGAITGAMSFFDIQEYSQKGGQLCDLSPLAFSTDNYAQNYMCFLSDQGELFVYEGIEAEDLSIVGRYDIAPPVGDGRDAFLPVEGDLYVITRTGLVSVKTLVRGGDREDYTLSTTFEKQWLENFSTTTYDWRGLWYPERNYVWIHSPSSVESFVYNRTTRGWSTFDITEDNIGSGILAAYYSKSSKAPVIHASETLYPFDPREIILSGTQLTEVVIKHSFSTLGQPAFLKKSLQQVRPRFELVGDGTLTPTQAEVFVDSDYLSSTSYTSGAGADIAMSFTNGTTVANDLLDLVGEGDVHSLVIKVKFGTDNDWAEFRYLGSTVFYREDGIT